MKILDRLFNKDSRTELSRKIRQAEREALADMILFAIYGDSELSLREEAVLDAESIAFGWESEVEFNYYRHAAINRVREAAESSRGREQFLASVSERLRSPGMSERALDLLDELLDAEGKSVRETEFYRSAARSLTEASSHR